MYFHLLDEPRLVHIVAAVLAHSDEVLLARHNSSKPASALAPFVDSSSHTLKDFVENLQYNAFNPLYTTDYRCFLGRYYRVTVNKYSSPPIYGASATRTVVTRRRR